MRLLLVADGRSPITRNWINMLQPLGHEIHLVTTFPCGDIPGTIKTYHIPVAFSQYSGSQAGGSDRKGNSLIARFRGAAAVLRHWLGPWTVKKQSVQLNRIVSDLKPDLVQALRIPFEGMLCSDLPPGIRLLVSTWGNDLTLHAPSTPKMRALTRKTLERANGLMSDVFRDVTLAADWGFDSAKPSLAVVGNGGLDIEEMQHITNGVKPISPVQVINPRGLRTYVRNDTFFQSIPLVLEKHPQVHFLCTSMQGQPEALAWVERLGINDNVSLLPMIPQDELWREMSRSTLSISVSTHDGTPNTLLEAMTLGCLPICGDLDSIREWITPGENGLLVDAGDPQSLANAICRGLEDSRLREQASLKNHALIKNRASINSVRDKVAEFYLSFFD